MIGRRVKLLRKGLITPLGEFPWKIPETHEVKHVASKNLRKYGYIILVILIRSYIKSSNYLKDRYGKVKTKVIENIDKRFNKNDTGEPKEASRFLKMVSEYKDKVKEIKQKIKEEETK